MNAHIRDPFGSMQGMMSQFQEFMKNPIQFLAKNKLNIPQEYANDPNKAAQYMMNTGQLSQEQYNWALRQSQTIQQNPMFMQMFGKR